MLSGLAFYMHRITYGGYIFLTGLVIVSLVAFF
jgi:hypothetical protein